MNKYMKLTKEKRQKVADAQKITSTIKNKLKEKDAEVKNKVDLSGLAKELADRRERVLKNEE